MATLQVTLGFNILFFSLGLDQSYVREFHEAENKSALLKRAMLPGLILLVITVLVLLSLGGSLAGYLFGDPQWHLSVLVALALVASYISRFCLFDCE
jgi:O-antigen/teichoic acid export membrane protein